ncbi:MAG: hypothetical protein M1834_007923 [Cirrosporium novae-zelandiae]|nr:MAG: hypothetical protein M1834_007923 [Cirrosporium novae-zelandiae]
MIDPKFRFATESGALSPEGPHTWVVLDYDQRRRYLLTGSAEIFPEHDYTKAPEILAKYINRLEPEVRSLNISDDGALENTSTDDTNGLLESPIYYPHYSGEDGHILERSQLIELDRLASGIDLVRAKGKLVAFKYALTSPSVMRVWNEMHIIKALKGHSSFVPFQQAIIDEVEPRLLGFTTLFMPAGTLQDNETIPFHFHWLHQLTSAVDDLNLRFGIMHRDIVPRNVAIDLGKTKRAVPNLKIFDFNIAHQIGVLPEENSLDDIDGVVLTVYEALTRDTRCQDITDKKPFIKEIEGLTRWKSKASIEYGFGGVAGYRRFLSKWAINRRNIRRITHYSQATEPIDWPKFLHLNKVPVEKWPTRIIPWEREPAAQLATLDRGSNTGLSE